MRTRAVRSTHDTNPEKMNLITRLHAARVVSGTVALSLDKIVWNADRVTERTQYRVSRSRLASQAGFREYRVLYLGKDNKIDGTIEQLLRLEAFSWFEFMFNDLSLGLSNSWSAGLFLKLFF